MAQITKDQTRKLRTLAAARFGACSCPRGQTRRAGDCDYHDWLEAQFGVQSTLALTTTQAARAIDALEGRPVRPPRAQRAASRGRYPVPGTPGMITQAQADALAALEDKLGWPAPYPSAQLRAMIGRQLRRPAHVHVPVHGLANRQASSVIVALSRLLRDRRASA